MRGKAKTVKKKKTAVQKKISKKTNKKRATLIKKILGSKKKTVKAKKSGAPGRRGVGAPKSKVKKITAAKKPVRKTAKKISATAKKRRANARKAAKKKTLFLEDKQLYSYLENLVGEEGMTVVKQVAQKERSDVDLAEKMDLKANIIRKHLYSMYEAGVVTYRRHRSKTGWYTYYWKLHPERITNAIHQEKNTQIKELMEMLEYEKTNHFYQCKGKCTRVVFDEATDLGFRCMKCNKPLEHSNNVRFIKDIEDRIVNLQTPEEPEEEKKE